MVHTEFDENMILQEFAKKTKKKRKTEAQNKRQNEASLMDLINIGCVKQENGYA